jgi:hypothetical protein
MEKFLKWRADKKRFFSRGELIRLKRLARFAAKVPGVANAKIGTVLKAICEEYGEMGISRSTFKRMILKASEIGIFTVYETARKNGSQSSNLYVFNRFPMNELPDGAVYFYIFLKDRIASPTILKIEFHFMKNKPKLIAIFNKKNIKQLPPDYEVVKHIK